MGEWLLIGLLFVCFGVINRWAHQRDLARAYHWGVAQADALFAGASEADPNQRPHKPTE
jgi:hypothetical protein